MSDSEDEILNHSGSEELSNESDNDSSSDNNSDNDSDDERLERFDHLQLFAQFEQEVIQNLVGHQVGQRGRRGRHGVQVNSTIANKKFIVLFKDKYSHTSHKITSYSLETVENPTICKNIIISLNNDILKNDFMFIRKEIERKVKSVNTFTDNQMIDMVKDYYNFFKSMLTEEELK